MTIFSLFGDTQPKGDVSSEETVQTEHEVHNNQDDVDEEFVQVATTQTGDSSVRSLEDHNVIVGFPPGTLYELFRAEQQEQDSASSCGETILSSAPSGAVLEPAPGAQSVFAISPHPQLATGSAFSISTTETQYGDEPQIMDDATPVSEDPPAPTNDDANNFGTTQFLSIPSTLDSTVIDDWKTDCSMSLPREEDSNAESHSGGTRHDRSSFVNVGNRLSSIPEDHPNCWYSNFDEQDWERFQQAADHVLDAVEPTLPTLALPPPAPPGSVIPESSYNVSALLPAAFICPLCCDAIVGATTLNCGCPTSTVCGPCWETLVVISSVKEQSNSEEVKPACPSCQGTVDQAVPCHALDVAILGAIQNPTTTNTTTNQLQQAYYYRLNKWRRVLQNRLERRSKEQQERRERLLAECIQREEELLWKQPKQKVGFLKARGWVLFSEVAFLLFAASLGMRLRPRS